MSAWFRLIENAAGLGASGVKQQVSRTAPDHYPAIRRGSFQPFG